MKKRREETDERNSVGLEKREQGRLHKLAALCRHTCLDRVVCGLDPCTYLDICDNVRSI